MNAVDERNRASNDAAAIKDSLEEPGAFEVLFSRHYDAIWRYVFRRVGEGLADELAGETFLRAFAGRAGYDLGQPDAGPWLYGIATNLMRKHARAEMRRRRAYARAAEREGIDDGIEGADARVDAAAQRSAVVSALDRLAPADRDTLLLFALSDLDYSGIAIATAVPVGTVRSRLHRARRQVRVELGLEAMQAAKDAKGERNRA